MQTQANLTATQGQLTTCQGERDTCTASLTSTQGQLATCNNSLTQTQASLDTCNTTLTTCNGDLDACETDLAACEARPHVVGDGQGGTSFEHGLYHGPALSYTNNNDGTFTDNNTGLTWEMKDAGTGSVHNWTNVYTWNTTAGGTTPNGTVFTVFLATLNTPPCFADHCDWRLPTAPELMSLADFSRSLPSTSIPDANLVQNTYWTATTYSFSPSGAILVGIRSLPSVTSVNKNVLGYARAVRGGVPPSP
jgi:hypothetical protein